MTGNARGMKLKFKSSDLRDFRVTQAGNENREAGYEGEYFSEQKITLVKRVETIIRKIIVK